ncbi:MAG TPA: class I SAM-dependent methyltransferase [Methylomirabilota bacterium]|nr:class I SAM-dependent methyltransferase [Methylomirabilota bacterium]
MGWYARAVERGDYAARVLEVLEPILADCRDALDVGAGCGALSLPLARRLEAVTALEPTPAMTRWLRAAAARRGLSNVTVVEAAWGETRVKPHDLVFCAHVGGLLSGDSPFLSEVAAIARRWVTLVRDAPAAQREDKFFFSELYPVLLGRPYVHRCDAEDTLAALGRLGIRPTVTVIEYSSDQPFDDLEEACDFWMTYLGLEEDGPRAYLRTFLRERLVRRGGEWIAPFRKRAAVIRWATGSA